jgi:hypothetical protein
MRYLVECGVFDNFCEFFNFFRVRKIAKMAYQGAQKVQKVMVQPIVSFYWYIIFRCLNDLAVRTSVRSGVGGSGRYTKMKRSRFSNEFFTVTMGTVGMQCLSN